MTPFDTGFVLLTRCYAPESVRQQQARRQRLEEKQVADGRRGAAKREENKRLKNQAGVSAVASPLGALGADDDEDDAFGWFSAQPARVVGDAEDEIAVAKASEAPIKKRPKKRKASAPEGEAAAKRKRQSEA